jgi:hypothetical protein
VRVSADQMRSPRRWTGRFRPELAAVSRGFADIMLTSVHGRRRPTGCGSGRRSRSVRSAERRRDRSLVASGICRVAGPRVKASNPDGSRAGRPRVTRDVRPEGPRANAARLRASPCQHNWSRSARPISGRRKSAVLLLSLDRRGCSRRPLASEVFVATLLPRCCHGESPVLSRGLDRLWTVRSDLPRQ